MTTDTFYETDFVTWTERQAAALREAAGRGAAGRGSNLPIDWEHLAEEIEDVGNEIRNRVESLAGQIQIDLLKIACSTFDVTRAHWAAEVDEFRDQLERQLRQNHALRARFPDIADEQFARSIKRVDRMFRRNDEPTVALARLGQWKLRGMVADEVLQDGLYPVPGTLTFHGEPT